MCHSTNVWNQIVQILFTHLLVPTKIEICIEKAFECHGKLETYAIWEKICFYATLELGLLGSYPFGFKSF